MASKGARKSTRDVAGLTNDQRLPSQIKKLQTTTDLLHPTLPSRRIVCAIAHGRNTDRRSTVPSRVLRNFSRHDQVTYCFPTHDYHTIYWRGELLRRLRRYNIFVSGLMVHKLTKYLQGDRPLWLPSIRLADHLRAFNSIPGTGVLHPQQVYESSGCAVAMVIQFSIFHSVAPVCAIQAYLHGCGCGMNSLSSYRPCNRNTYDGRDAVMEKGSTLFPTHVLRGGEDCPAVDWAP